jgi:predicted N-acetyltransferase YhbS
MEVYRAAKLEEADTVFAIINEAYKVEDGNTGVAFKKLPRLLDKFDCGMGDAYNEGRVLLLEVDGEIQGVIVWEHKANEKAMYFGPLAVPPMMQKKGIAHKLISQIAKLGQELGCDYIEISVVNHRTDIIPYYQRMGFETTSEGEFPDPDRVTRPCSFYIMRMDIANFLRSS